MSADDDPGTMHNDLAQFAIAPAIAASRIALSAISYGCLSAPRPGTPTQTDPLAPGLLHQLWMKYSQGTAQSSPVARTEQVARKALLDGQPLQTTMEMLNRHDPHTQSLKRRYGQANAHSHLAVVANSAQYKNARYRQYANDPQRYRALHQQRQTQQSRSL